MSADALLRRVWTLTNSLHHSLHSVIDRDHSDDEECSTFDGLKALVENCATPPSTDDSLHPSGMELPVGESILQAAILGADGITIHTQPRPKRHGNIMQSMWAAGHGKIGPDNQGFITTAGRFVGREEAFTIAHNAKQIITADAESGHLMSEDVW